MNKYELLLVLPGTLDEKEAGKLVEEIKTSVSANSQDVELNNLGKVRLAYPIKQIRYGYYYTLVFNAEPAAVKIISDKLRLRADVLRSMISHFNTNVTAATRLRLRRTRFVFIAFSLTGKPHTPMLNREATPVAFPASASPAA